MLNIESIYTYSLVTLPTKCEFTTMTMKMTRSFKCFLVQEDKTGEVVCIIGFLYLHQSVHTIHTEVYMLTIYTSIGIHFWSHFIHIIPQSPSSSFLSRLLLSSLFLEAVLGCLTDQFVKIFSWFVNLQNAFWF